MNPPPCPTHELDPWALADLARYGRSRGSEALEHLATAFAAETREAAAHLASAADDGDLAEVAAEAHRLRGTSLGMAAAALARCFAQIENAARIGDTEEVAESIGHLQICVPRTLATLQRVLFGSGSADRTEAQP